MIAGRYGCWSRCRSLSPLAHAQFANVSLYGSLNLDVELVNGAQSDGSNPSIVRVSSNSSRFGLRGHEYLGRGQVAIFQLESSVLGDTGGSTLASRETWVGLQGDWGTVKLGSFLTPYDDIHTIFGNTPTLDNVDPFDRGALGARRVEQDRGRIRRAARQLDPLRDAAAPGLFRRAAVRHARYVRRSEWRRQRRPAVGAAARERHRPAGAFYNNGPLDLGIAYERNYRIRPTGPTDDALSLTGGYDFGPIASNVGLRVAGVYERLKYDTPTGSLDARLLRTVDARSRSATGPSTRSGARPPTARAARSTARRSERWSKARIRRASNGSCRTATTCRCARCSTPAG